MKTVLVARLDSVGDVLLTGPAVRAIAATGAHVRYLASHHAAAVAELLPGVDRVDVFDAGWVLNERVPVDRAGIERLVELIEWIAPNEAIIFTSFHQSPLPLAMAMRMAAVPRIGAISVDYPGTLLDVRHTVGEDLHEVERSLSLARACGYGAPVDLALAIDRERIAVPVYAMDALPERYVVVHPGASASARTWSPERFAEAVRCLRWSGRDVVVTGSADEMSLVAGVAGPAELGVINLAGRLDVSGLALVLERADAVVVGNTGPAHLAAAVGCPVVAIFPPTVPLERWRPWMVPHVVLGDQQIECRGCRARVCPRQGHPCVDHLTAGDVVAAVRALTDPKPVNHLATMASGDR